MSETTRRRQRWWECRALTLLCISFQGLCAFLSAVPTTGFTLRPHYHIRPTTAMSSAKADKEILNQIKVSLSVAERIAARSTQKKNSLKKKYKRKRIPESEKEAGRLLLLRQQEYEQIMSRAKNGRTRIWSFESLFPEPIWDEESIKRDLYEIQLRDNRTTSTGERSFMDEKKLPRLVAGKLRSSFYGSSAMMRVWREPKVKSAYLPYFGSMREAESISAATLAPVLPVSSPGVLPSFLQSLLRLSNTTMTSSSMGLAVDRNLTRLVEERLFGYRRTRGGDFQYETSLMGDGAVQFRNGVRLGNPLRINGDRLTYMAKKELQRGRVEEAQELYEKAMQIDPRDGRSYLGLSRCAERRRDFKLAREYLQAGIANSISVDENSNPDRGYNPYLLQALGCLEEKRGHLSKAEALFISAVKSRPSHAAAWVSLAQLRTRKLGQSASAGRACFEAAERELKREGLPPSAHVYTAWGSMEYHKAGDARRARQLFKAALLADPKCSAAWLQLAVLESNSGNWKEAHDCFESVLKFDQRNSRVLQAYALMETKRPEGSSRKALGLFERALAANPRDAGVLQAYALYVAELGDYDAARDLLRRGTEVNKRHAPVWQAWGVLEARLGTAEAARSIFQQGIWSCAQLAGSQSGGYDCARLWHAWGMLEAKEGNHGAARRCFSRALDADSRNVAAVTAWALMEEGLDCVQDARSIFERALNKFSPGSSEKMVLWRAYELMEKRRGDVASSQQVYNRAMRETIAIRDDSDNDNEAFDMKNEPRSMDGVLEKRNEVEVSNWKGGGEVWLNDHAIESKLPFQMKKRRRRP